MTRLRPRYPRLLAVVFLLLVLASALAPSALAADTNLQAGHALTTAADEDVTWTYRLESSGDVVITGYTLHNGITEISIPRTIDGHEVGAVEDGVFRGDTQLVKVTFPSTVVRLGERLFENCTNLTYVDLTDVEQLGVIPSYCFNGCTALTSVDIPASVMKIMSAAFQGCTSLKQVNIPLYGNLDDIGVYAFRNCESLESLEFPASLQSISQFAFENCKSVASITFMGASITVIHTCAFKGCSALEELYLPDRVGAIDTKAFANCRSLKVVAFGRELPQMIRPDLFDGCDAIELMLFPTHGAAVDPSESDMRNAGWTEDMAYMTYYVTIGGDDAAIHHIVPSSKHTVVTVPAKIGYRPVKHIDSFAAYNRTLLAEVRFPSDTEVDHISLGAFSGCIGLQKIEIPATVTQIDRQAFMGCVLLSSVEFKTTSLSTIASETFSGCASLTEVTIPEGVDTIEDHAFFNCLTLKTVNLPDSLQYIQTQAFGCEDGKHMAIETMRMPNSSGDLDIVPDKDFFVPWIRDNQLSTFKFEVTYGSTADYLWLEPRVNCSDPEHYPIPLNEYNRVYVPVDIGENVGTEEHPEYTTVLVYDQVENWTGKQVIPEVTAKRWWRTTPVGSPHLTVEPVAGDDCTEVGPHHIKVTGNDPYFTGERILKYEIVQSNVEDVQMEPVSGCVWDDEKWEPHPVFYVQKSNPNYSFLLGEGESTEGVYTLVEGQDYTITKYEHNKMAGSEQAGSEHPPTIWIEGKGNFKGKAPFMFAISPANLGNTQVKVVDQMYTGEAVTPVPSEVMLLDRGGEHYTVPLYEGEDYKVTSYESNTNVGTATLTLVPADDCTWLTGSKVVTFEIVEADLSKATVEAVSDQVYTGSAITPDLVVKIGDQELEEGVAYTVTWDRGTNVNVGTATGTVTGIEPYCKGTLPVTFEITPKPATITVADASKIKGEADPVFTGKVEGLVAAGDLGKVRYVRTNHAETAGTYTGVLDAEFTANANYDVTVKKGDFTITMPDYSVRFDANVPANASTACTGSMEDQSFAYGETKPLSENGYILPGYDFKGWNTKADGTGTAYADKAEVQGLTEDGGTVTLFAQWRGKPYTIWYWSDDVGSQEHAQTAYFDKPGKLEEYSDSAFVWSSDGKTLHGWFGAAFGSFLEDGEDFCNLCGAPDADGNVTDVVLTADWVQDGQIVVSVTKDSVPQSGLTGFHLVQDITATIFTVPFEYQNGRYVFNPSNETSVEGSQDRLPLGGYDIRFAASGYPTASAHIVYGNDEPARAVFDYYTVTLEPDPAYRDAHQVKMVQEKPDAGGRYTAIVRDDGMVEIETTVNEGYRFVGYTAVGVEPKWQDNDPSQADQTIEVQGTAAISAHVSPIEYSVIVEGGTADKATARLGETVSIMADAPEPGMAFVQWTSDDGVVFGSADSAETTITMPAKDVTVTAVTAPIIIETIADKVYTGERIEPADEVKVSLEGVDLILTADDYAVSFEDNLNAGDAKAIVTMKSPRAGSASATFKILPADISESTAAIADQEYSGAALEPDPVVTWNGRVLSKGTDYTVSYENNVNVGTASFTITGKGNFTGTKRGTFKIEESPVPPQSRGTLTFDLGGGTIDGKTSLTIEADVGDIIIIPEAPVRDGYTFQYWKGSKYYPGDKYTVEGDHKFTAVWEKKSDGGGGSSSGDSSSGDTKGTSSPGSSATGSTTKTGDELDGAIAAFGAIAVFALCLALFALRRRRQPGKENRL